MSFKKPRRNLYKVDTIGAWQKWLLYGDVPFIESTSKNQKSSKVNMKSTVCHDFPSPHSLEGPNDGKIKRNGKFFSFWSLQTRFTTLVHLTTDLDVHIIYNIIYNKEPFLLKMCQGNNGQCREKNEKLCKLKSCRKINLRYQNGFLVPVSALQGRSSWTLPHPCIDIQPTTRGRF